LATFNDGNVYLLWTENRILQNPFRPSEIAPDTDDFFVASMDNGRTFGTPINLKPILTVVRLAAFCSLIGATEAPNVSISVCLTFGAVKTSSSISAGRQSTEILLGVFLFVAYVHKNAHRSCHQNNNANYDWVHIIRAEFDGKKGLTYMLRNSLKNRHIKMHYNYTKAREDKPFQCSRIRWLTMVDRGLALSFNPYYSQCDNTYYSKGDRSGDLSIPPRYIYDIYMGSN